MITVIIRIVNVLTQISIGNNTRMKCYGPLKPSLLGPDLACPVTNVVSDREDDRLRSRKPAFTDSMRKVGSQTWGSDSVPDYSKGSLAPVKERGT
jgi:hypothetical protein